MTDQRLDQPYIRPTLGMLNEVEIQNIELRAENKRLRAALEKHHWPDLVPGDGPCDICGLSAEEWYESLARPDDG